MKCTYIMKLILFFMKTFDIWATKLGFSFFFFLKQFNGMRRLRGSSLYFGQVASTLSNLTIL